MLLNPLFYPEKEEKEKAMKKFIFLQVTLLISGCATSKSIQGPNGSQAYLISCGSAVIEQCYEEASKVCPGGYIFLDRNNNPNTVIMPIGNSYMVVRGRNKMFVECK